MLCSYIWDRAFFIIRIDLYFFYIFVTILLMKKTLFALFFVSIIFNGLVFAKSIASESKDVTDKNHDGFLQLSSMSIDIMQFGLTKPGIGLSYDFEKYLGAHLALEGNFGGGFFYSKWFDFDNLFLTGSTGVNLRLYPFHDSLRGFYFGTGAGMDAMLYLGNQIVSPDAQKFFGYVKPEIGWKYYLFNHLMIDVNMNYKWQSVLDRDSLPSFYLDSLDDGFHLGLAFKFFWAK